MKGSASSACAHWWMTSKYKSVQFNCTHVYNLAPVQVYSMCITRIPMDSLVYDLYPN